MCDLFFFPIVWGIDLFFTFFQRQMSEEDRIAQVRNRTKRMLVFFFFLIANYSYLGSVDSARVRRRQKMEMSTFPTEPKSLEETGHRFNESKEEKSMKGDLYL